MKVYNHRDYNLSRYAQCKKDGICVNCGLYFKSKRSKVRCDKCLDGNNSKIFRKTKSEDFVQNQTHVSMSESLSAAKQQGWI